MTRHDLPLKLEQLELARWTASLGAITAEALAVRLGTTTMSARARLTVGQRRGLLARSRPLFGRPALYTVTSTGLRRCDARGMKVCHVSASNANHLIECAAIAAVLERRYPDHRVIGERELRRDEREQGRLLASAELGTFGVRGAGVHSPDLVLWPQGSDDELPVSVEVELTLKAPSRLFEICRAWARSRTVAGVLYVAPPNVRRALSRAVDEAHGHERIAVVALEELAGMAALADRRASS